MAEGMQEQEFVPVGVPIDFTNCDLEPIHIPCAVQPHGALLAARASDLRIAYASANTMELLGVAPALLLGQSLEQVVGAAVLSGIEEALGSEQCLPGNTRSYPLAICNGVTFDILAHRAQGMLCVELERSAEDRRWDLLLARMQAGIRELREQKTGQALWTGAVQHVRVLTGYDRVMIYRFDPEGNGEVIAEACAHGMEPYLGLHYPASDIPLQARKMYLLQRMRMIVDVGYEPVALLAHPDLAGSAPLDMTYCALRSVSPVHLEYLRNMGVGATLAVSLIHKGELWGMIVCHHRTAKRTSPEARAFCELLGQILSLLIESANQAEGYQERLERQAILSELATIVEEQESVTSSLARHGDKLLALMAADGVFLRLGGQMRLLGKTPSLDEASAIMAAMRPNLMAGLLASNPLRESHPEFAHLASVASGVLMVQIPAEAQSGILWFRGEVAQSVLWAGNPKEAHVHHDGSQRLSPRLSFAKWEEVQRGRSRPWSSSDLQIAREMQRLVTNTLLHHVEAKLAQLSYYDALTGLPNRRMLIERLAVWRSQNDPELAVLLFLDIDNFKAVNDSLGHSVGDELLRQIANRLRLCTGTKNLVARLGGDEFVIFCRDILVEAAEEIAAEILKTFTDPFLLGGKPFRTTASIGIAPMNMNSVDDAAEPLRAADAAMYSAKKLGGNRLIVFEAPQQEKALRQLSLEQGLFQALERKELLLEYQAQLSCPAGELIGFEALLRWNHPVYGSISPAEFIPLAEKSGQIVPIGLWVLEEALRQARTWHDMFGNILTMSVNVSMHQVSQPDFAQTVQHALNQAGVPGSAVRLEVTESIFMEDAAACQLEQARSAGVLISVDDFGTGYSALAYLQRLPIDEIKIDKSMLEGVTSDTRKLALLKAIVQLAHALDLTVVAEGVETRQQWECLRKLECDAAQGYFISLPLPSATINAKIDELGYQEAFLIEHWISQRTRALL